MGRFGDRMNKNQECSVVLAMNFWAPIHLVQRGFGAENSFEHIVENIVEGENWGVCECECGGEARRGCAGMRRKQGSQEI